FDMIGEVAEVGANGDLGAVGAKGECHWVGGIVWNTKSMDVDVADREALAGLDGFYAAQTFTEGFGENALHRAQSGLGNVQRRVPQPKHLRQTIAVVRVLVTDEDAVKALDGSFHGSETGERFALPEPGVHEEAGALGLEERHGARAARRQDGNPQAER